MRFRLSWYGYAACALIAATLPDVADARFLQVDPVGYKDQINLYAYVANDPINATDPDGKKIVVEDPAVRQAITRVERSNPELNRRYNEMVRSERVATVVAGPKGADIQTTANVLNASNGKGSDVTVTVQKSTVMVDDVKADTADQVAHDVFSHGYESMRGTEPTGINPDTKVEKNEERAVGVENLYRKSVNDPQIRTKYEGKEVAPDDPKPR